MTAKQLVQANLASARKELAETFAHLTDELLDWAPAPGMHTVHRVFMDIATTEECIIDRLQSLPRKTDEEFDAPYLPIKTVSGLVEKMGEVRQATLHYVDSLDEAALNGPAPISDAFEEQLELSPAPVAEVLRYIARHESYHAGQLVSYLWAHGDDPYTWD